MRGVSTRDNVIVARPRADHDNALIADVHQLHGWDIHAVRSGGGLVTLVTDSRCWHWRWLWLAAIVGGAAVAKLTDRSMLAGGLRQFTAAFLATGVAFAVGHLIGGVVS